MQHHDPTPHLERFETYQQACRELSLSVPSRFNIANEICRRHPDAVTRVALNDVKAAGSNSYTFGGLDYLSDKFATALAESGIERGHSVAVIASQSAAAAVAQLGALKLGAAVVPLSPSSEHTLLQRVIAGAGSKAVVIDEAIEKTGILDLRQPTGAVPVFVVRDLRPLSHRADQKDFWSEVDRASSDFKSPETPAAAPAFIFHGLQRDHLVSVIHSHASVASQLAAFEMSCDLAVRDDAVFWTEAKWASPTTLLSVLYPAWWYGCSMIAYSASEDRDDRQPEPRKLLRLFDRYDVTNAVFSSSLLEALDDARRDGSVDFRLRRIIHEGVISTALGGLKGIGINLAYGKPETGWIAASCAPWFSTAQGSVGRPVPGRLVEVVDEGGQLLPRGEIGRIAVHKSDPGLSIGYQNASEPATAAFCGDWFLTGDSGCMSDDRDLYIGC